MKTSGIIFWRNQTKYHVYVNKVPTVYVHDGNYFKKTLKKSASASQKCSAESHQKSLAL